jgi:putative transposase
VGHRPWGSATAPTVRATRGSAELIKRRGPWKTLSGVELATAEYIDWYNARRLHTAIEDVPPNEHEALYYAQHQPREAVGANH